MGDRSSGAVRPMQQLGMQSRTAVRRTNMAKMRSAAKVTTSLARVREAGYEYESDDSSTSNSSAAKQGFGIAAVEHNAQLLPKEEPADCKAQDGGRPRLNLHATMSFPSIEQEMEIHRRFWEMRNVVLESTGKEVEDMLLQNEMFYRQKRQKMAALTAELKTLEISALDKRATEAGVNSERLEQAKDAYNAKEELTKLIVEICTPDDIDGGLFGESGVNTLDPFFGWNIAMHCGSSSEHFIRKFS